MLGDLTEVEAGAVILPQFNDQASYGSLGGNMYDSGAKKGIDEFNKFAKSNRPLEWGKVLVTESGKKNPKYLIHVVSLAPGGKTELDSSARLVKLDSSKEFETVHKAFFKCLKEAQKKNIKTVAAPTMGYGIIGSLDASESAEAMLSAVKKFAKAGGKLTGISIIIYKDKDAYKDFKGQLERFSQKQANFIS